VITPHQYEQISPIPTNPKSKTEPNNPPNHNGGKRRKHRVDRQRMARGYHVVGCGSGGVVGVVGEVVDLRRARGACLACWCFSTHHRAERCGLGFCWIPQPIYSYCCRRGGTVEYFKGENVIGDVV
jgi:hypothetical protein